MPPVTRTALIALASLISIPASAQVASGDYRMQLESTVGLRETCESDGARLILPVGVHDVVVCLRATNVSEELLTVHNIVSEQLGPLVGDRLYTLGPRESVYYTYAVPIAQTAGLVSRWMAQSARGAIACATAWSVVVVGDAPLSSDGHEFIGAGLVCPPDPSTGSRL